MKKDRNIMGGSPAATAAEKQEKNPREKAVEATRKKTKQVLTQKERILIETVIDCLEKDDINMALRYYEDYGRKGFNWSAHERWEATVKKKVLNHLRDGHTELAKELHDSLGRGMDFTTCKGYEKAVKEEFLTCIKTGWIDRAIEICEQWGRGIDMTEQIEEGFFFNMRHGASQVEKIRDGIGRRINFRACKGYKKAVREGFLFCLLGGKMETAVRIRDEFGSGISMTKEIKEGFMTNLERGIIFFACEIRRRLGEGIDFSACKDYEKTVKAVFLNHLRTGQRMDEVLQLRDDLGKGINFREHPDYAPVMSKRFKEVVDPEIANFLSSSGISLAPEESMFSEYEAALDNDDLLLDFEGCMIYVADHFRRKIKERIKKLGSPTGDPAELTEEKQAKLQAFAVNLHTELSVKIHAIASPELIAAYLEQNNGGTGSEFLTLAA